MDRCEDGGMVDGGRCVSCKVVLWCRVVPMRMVAMRVVLALTYLIANDCGGSRVLILRLDHVKAVAELADRKGVPGEVVGRVSDGRRR